MALMPSYQSKVGSNDIEDDKDLAEQEEGMATQQELDEVKDNEDGSFDKTSMNNAALYRGVTDGSLIPKRLFTESGEPIINNNGEEVLKNVLP